MAFKKELPQWKAAGIQPPESKRVKGWEVEDRPPADWLNWQMNTTYEALQELHEKAAEKDDVSKALKDAKEYTDKKAQAITPESIGAETPEGAQSKADAAKQTAEQKIADHTNNAQVHVSATDRQEWDEAAAEVSNAPAKDLTFTPGLQVVESEQDAPFRMGEVKGRTLINLPGSEGNFDYRTSPLPVIFGTGEITASNGPIGSKCQRVICNRAEDNAGHFAARYELNIDRSKHYLAMAYMENVSCDIPAYFSIAEMKDTGYTSLRWSAKISKGSGMQYLYTTISPTQMENREKLVYYFRGEGTGGAEFRIGPFAFYEVTQTEYNAISTMTPEQVAERYPYVDSMTNVTNPYAIVTGGNLLPPFYEWRDYGVVAIEGEYSFSFDSDGITKGMYHDTVARPESKYGIRSNCSNASGTVQVEYYKDFSKAGNSSEFLQPPTFGKANEYVYITTPKDCGCIRVFLSNHQQDDTNPAGQFDFSDIVMFPGTEPKPFVPQQRSMIAFETELAANPIDGSNPDTMFMGDDGLPYVLEPWKKVTLDGTLDWKRNARLSGYKELYVDLPEDSIGAGTAYITKYNGSLLEVKYPTTAGDQYYGMGSAAPKRLFLSVSNADSGWGQDYNPEPEEIKAYFLGYRMANEDGTPYTDGTKYWNKLYCGYGTPLRHPAGSVVVDGWFATSVPTTMNDMGYTPYRLQYLKAKPTVEPVRNYELGATLTAGSNMVEVGSGIVIRESVHPWNKDGNYYINASGSPLKYRCASIIDVFRNHNEDYKWTLRQRSPSDADISLGTGFASITNGFDPTAVYHVAYTMLDPTLAAPISGTVAANLRGTVTDLVQDVGDVQRRLSVSEVRLNSITSDLNSSLDWITATLLNGWKSVSGRPVQYTKDALGFVHFRGALDSGEAAKAVGTDIFILPVSYRPPRIMGVPTVTYGSPQDIQAYAIDVGNGGSVRVTMENTRRFVHLETLSFYAGGGTT